MKRNNFVDTITELSFLRIDASKSAPSENLIGSENLLCVIVEIKSDTVAISLTHL